MAVYEDGNSSINSNALSQIEVHLYGSSRLGLWHANRDVEAWPAADYHQPDGVDGRRGDAKPEAWRKDL